MLQKVAKIAIDNPEPFGMIVIVARATKGALSAFKKRVLRWRKS